MSNIIELPKIDIKDLLQYSNYEFIGSDAANDKKNELKTNIMFKPSSENIYNEIKKNKVKGNFEKKGK